MTFATASPLAFADYLRHDALGLAALVRSGQVGAHELLDAALARTAAVNPQINAVTTLLAEQARRQIDAGLPQGPFTGVPFLLKDWLRRALNTVQGSGSRGGYSAV